MNTMLLIIFAKKKKNKYFRLKIKLLLHYFICCMHQLYLTFDAEHEPARQKMSGTRAHWSFQERRSRNFSCAHVALTQKML